MDNTTLEQSLKNTLSVATQAKDVIAENLTSATKIIGLHTSKLCKSGDLAKAQGKTVQYPDGHLGLQLPFGQMAKQELEFNIIAYLVKTGGLEPILDMTRLMVMKNGHIAEGFSEEIRIIT